MYTRFLLDLFFTIVVKIPINLTIPNSSADSMRITWFIFTNFAHMNSIFSNQNNFSLFR